MKKISIWWEYNKGKVIAAVVFCIISVISFFGIYFFNTMKAKADSISLSDEDNSILKKDDDLPVLKNVSEENKVKVDIKGAVKKPGVYEVESGKRVMDVIDMAGGVLTGADTSVINLSKKIKDEMVIILYTKDELKNISEVKKEQEEKNEKCTSNNTEINNDACVGEKNTSNIQSNKININTASKDELLLLTGIGESKADKIIEYREKNGGFKSIEDILNVSGIGQSVFEKIKDNISI